MKKSNSNRIFLSKIITIESALTLLILLTITSCAHKNSELETSKYANQFKNDTFSYSGSYTWVFNLMGAEQVSTHTFYEDSIEYSMDGRIHSTDYTMQKLSYEKDKNKWIGEDENKFIYVLFFKDKTDSTINIFKHKCKTNGLKEALEYDVPAPDETSDHGWNVYALNGNDTKDLLPISGTFINKEDKISISDSIIIFEDKEVQKVSFHLGERRWVGKYQNKYLQLFFKNFNTNDSLQLSASWYTDLEKLYKTKYNPKNDWKNYEKK